jgi:hypothetical protein
MTPDQVRARVLDEHQKIREFIDEIDDLNKRFGRDEAVGSEIRDLGTGLYEVFAAHIALEDATLAPMLAEIPDRGPDLADRLVREHCEQRAMLGFLLRRLDEAGRPTALVSNELNSFCDYVRRDMEYEENTVLNYEPV